MPRDPRQLPFLSRHFNKIVGAVIVGLPLLYLAHVHLDYSSEAHGPREDNPISALAYTLNHADQDASRAYHTVGNASDKVMANIEGRPVPPPTLNDNPPTPPSPAIAPRQFPVEICVPADLVDNQAWENPASGSRMAAFRAAVKSFIVNYGNPNQQYRIKEGAFENFNEASTPRMLLDAVRAGAPCPANDYPYTIPVVR